jgi:DNA-binding NtrC family response regulator
VSRRILVSWIGHNDLRAMASSLPTAEKADLVQALGAGPALSEDGPIRTLTQQEAFDEIHLLSNYEAEWNRSFAKWLTGQTKVHRVELANPTDYEKIFQIADAFLSKLNVGRAAGSDLCIHLSPGTPAMTAVWVLLGKSRYPATFFQTHKGRAWRTDIPFNLVVDFIPEVLRDADVNLQHLSASAPADLPGFEAIVGDSRAIREAAGRAKLAAVRDVPVLIVGESGTGKELFARAIHDASRRKDKPFMAVNCAAIPRELLEAELFGHEEGAFTGAKKARPGLFERADQGTLFLDEIGECDTGTQVRLLRLLQPPPGKGPCIRCFERVGGTKTVEADVRVLAATNRNLIAAIQTGSFREDLYYRLAVITLKLPPLRDRRSDIPGIASALLAGINDSFRRDEPGYIDKSFSASAIEFVRRHDWPGNVRQLQNVLVQAAVMTQGPIIDRRYFVDALAETPSGTASPLEAELGNGFNLQDHLNSIHRHYLQRAMNEAEGVKTRAAKLLGIDNYQTLDAQLKRLKVHGN